MRNTYTCTSKNAITPRDQKFPAFVSSLASGLLTVDLGSNTSLSIGRRWGFTSTILQCMRQWVDSWQYRRHGANVGGLGLSLCRFQPATRCFLPSPGFPTTIAKIAFRTASFIASLDFNIISAVQYMIHFIYHFVR